jgi:MFS family permease
LLKSLTTDGRQLFLTRFVRLFAYGFLSVVLTLYLAALGFTDKEIGFILTLTLIGDAAISIWITTNADRVGRRKMLMVGSWLMVFAGLAFAFTSNPKFLVIAAIIGTISPTGSEVGPFLSIEQAILPQTMSDKDRTQVFAWYNLVGSFASAIGSLSGGAFAGLLQKNGSSSIFSYRAIVIGYAVLGILLFILFTKLSQASEAIARDNNIAKSRFGLHRSQSVVLKLSALFMIDSFAGGLVLQSLMAYWFHLRFGVEPALLGAIFFGGNIFAGLSAIFAARLAARFGLVNTMVFTHIPSNILLILVPLMPNLTLAIIVLLARFSISQMDVPTRQSYIMAVVSPDERSAATGITSIVRTASSAIAPIATGILLENSLLSVPFFLAGSLKIVYDLALYQSFRSIKPPEELGKSN